jgi:transporter family-2 protein
MMTKLLLALLAICAGIAASIQSAANAALAQRTGFGAALVINTCVVMVGALALLFARGSRANFHPAGTPWSLYIGGVCGFIIIATLAFIFLKIGAAVAMGLVVLGQSVSALAIDHFGLMGMPRDPISVVRVIGVALVACGVVLLRL